jgi:hypothetical protein
MSIISDDRRTVMTKKFDFITEYLLLQGIGDERIFVTQASRITNRNEKTICDI